MSDVVNPSEDEALQILGVLISTPFESCISVGRDFSSLTTCHSLYAIRHRNHGLLYIGKSQNPRQRFSGGHKALVWSWLELYHPSDVRITTYPLNYDQWSQLSLMLESLIIRATEPPFNVRIPMRD
jgi:GIY-YIG catalytic domain